jgi:hypothetical protein
MKLSVSLVSMKGQVFEPADGSIQRIFWMDGGGRPFSFSW